MKIETENNRDQGQCATSRHQLIQSRSQIDHIRKGDRIMHSFSFAVSKMNNGQR